MTATLFGTMDLPVVRTPPDKMELVHRFWFLVPGEGRTHDTEKVGTLPGKAAAIFVKKPCPDRYPQVILEASAKDIPKVIF
jgi:hypothetical protein